MRQKKSLCNMRCFQGDCHSMKHSLTECFQFIFQMNLLKAIYSQSHHVQQFRDATLQTSWHFTWSTAMFLHQVYLNIHLFKRPVRRHGERKVYWREPFFFFSVWFEVHQSLIQCGGDTKKGITKDSIVQEGHRWVISRLNQEWKMEL